ncbi:outer membrane protein OmpA-like peptidoglycan-associated protein [Povalibacter uvarum]|uniref:Outer membrane protein OmpA-like peptidoglycan-associated protein n=1 Tax=Povalibacter uvarum TaxID=732238 RepID=A0A841HU56_9GAMM|nr:OmpA family protein [Povalibacter uvarum]MBB6095740.1 outer membrane protein OmpA-like peptidoglycan-associated protein [Povalibacter uvarum]
MNIDLLDIFNSTLGGPLVRQTSGLLGESEESTRAAARAAGPTLLAALIQRAASPQGIGEIFRATTSDNIDSHLPAKLPGVLANRGTMESLLSSGEALTGMLFGGRTGPVTNAISQVSGARPNSAMTLLSMAAPLLFGMLKKFVSHNDLDPSALASLVLRQRPSLERAGLDPRITQALGFGSLNELLASVPAAGAGVAGAAVAKAPTRDKPWLPWAVAAGVAVLGVMFFVNRTSEYQEAPGGAVQIAEVPQDSTPLRVAEADTTKVYFELGDASIDQEDRQRIADMAQSARSSDRSVAITGYTDRTGDELQNAELAKNRAMAVREALVDEGVQVERIVMDPPRNVTGDGTEDEARRVDIDMR